MAVTLPRLGLRREVSLFLPVALLVLVVVSTFTLFTYRNAVRTLTEERRSAALRLARRAAEVLPPEAQSTPATLSRAVPGALGAALVDATGRELARTGSVPGSDLLAPLAGRRLSEAIGLGPDPERSLPARVAGFAPLERQGRRLYLRVDLDAERLAAESRTVGILSAVVIPANVAVLVLVLLFLRHLLVPYETLLERARQVSGTRGGEEDEIGFLVSTFERALAALSRAPEPGTREEIAALERTLGASLESGVLLIDQAGAVLALNAVGGGLLAIPPPSPGQPLAEVLSPHPELLEIVARAVDTGRAVHRQECTLRVDGASRDLGLTVHALRRDDGSVRGFLMLFADITEVRRRAEEERVAHSLSQVGELAAGIAHELRNSLATLRGYLTLIERRSGEESITDYLAEIQRESDHLQRVLEDFLSFARPGSARPESVDLGLVARRAAADPTLADTPIVVGADEKADLLLTGDPQLLERAIRNLLLNAAEAQRASGADEPLSVRLRSDAGGIELVVEDRGPGVPARVRERLFQPFVTGRPGGVGLGLALSHRIVSIHGGRLRLEDRPGGGTRVALRFPPGTDVTKVNDAAPSTPAAAAAEESTSD